MTLGSNLRARLFDKSIRERAERVSRTLALDEIVLAKFDFTLLLDLFGRGKLDRLSGCGGSLSAARRRCRRLTRTSGESDNQRSQNDFR